MSHFSHWKFCAFSCTSFMWLFKCPAWVKYFSQWLHLWSLFFRWTLLTCCLWWWEYEDVFPQYSHLYLFSPSWTNLFITIILLTKACVTCHAFILLEFFMNNFKVLLQVAFITDKFLTFVTFHFWWFFIGNVLCHAVLLLCFKLKAYLKNVISITNSEN